MTYVSTWPDGKVLGKQQKLSKRDLPISEAKSEEKAVSDLSAEKQSFPGKVIDLSSSQLSDSHCNKQDDAQKALHDDKPDLHTPSGAMITPNTHVDSMNANVDEQIDLPSAKHTEDHSSPQLLDASSSMDESMTDAEEDVASPPIDSSEKQRLESALKESEDRVSRLRQTIQSKYAEFKAMRDTVKQVNEQKDQLLQENEMMRRKYAAAKKRIVHLEKNKLGEDVKEKVRQLLATKEALKEENQGLRKESGELHRKLSALNSEISGKIWREMLSRIKEPVGRIDSAGGREKPED